MYLFNPIYSFILFFTDTATTDIYTLSLHDALPTSRIGSRLVWVDRGRRSCRTWPRDLHRSRAPNPTRTRDRKSTRLNSSHTVISYAVFCLKKKKKNTTNVYVPITTCNNTTY